MKRSLRRLPTLLGGLLLAAGLIYGFWPVPREVDVAQARQQDAGNEDETS